MNHELFSTLYGNPWMIKTDSWYGLHNHAINAKTHTPEAAEIPGPSIEGGIAIIPIQGTMIHKVGELGAYLGAIDHQVIGNQLDAAVDASVSGILLDAGSPGGTVQGTPELAEKIGRIAQEVPIFAYTDSLMCSACYYACAGCTAIFATPSATVGSIGVIWETYNVAKALEQIGIEFNIFTSGPFKGTGHPAKQLTEEQAAWMQEHVDMLATEFKAHVLSFRDVDDTEMQGQVFTGRQAANNGLIDGNVSRFDEVLDMMR